MQSMWRYFALLVFKAVCWTAVTSLSEAMSFSVNLLVCDEPDLCVEN